ISGTGQRYLNMIHRDDLAGIIIAALERASPGEIYNATDEEPVKEIDFFKWLSEKLRRPLPLTKSESSEAERKRPLTSKRISNLKARRALAYTWRYPTFREGYTAEILRARLQVE